MAAKKVLVVDDEAAVRDLVAGLLRHLGHEARTAGTGAEALAALGAADFDLHFVDLQMPGMRGDELAAEIKKRKPDTVVVLITGSEPRELPSAIDHVLLKPFSLDDLRLAIAAVSF
jgi:CheY-like chemotaxis protein